MTWPQLLSANACRHLGRGAGVVLAFIAGAGALRAAEPQTASAALGAYTEVRISVPADVELLADPRHGYTISAEPQVISAVSFTVQGRKLMVEARKDFDTRKPVKITLRLPLLSRLEALGSVEVSSKVPTMPERLELVLDGASSLQMGAVQSRTASVQLKGSGSVRLAGRADKLVLALQGSADADLKQLQSQDAEVTIAGSGDVGLAVSQTLVATISGAGEIGYIGQPRVTQNISGAGEVKRLR